MDNARKKYVSIKWVSIGDIFGLLDSIENDDEVDTGNIMNDSDTEFVAEDKSISLLVSLEKKRLVTKVAPYQFQKHQSTFCLTKNEDETETLGQDEPNSAPVTQHTSNQSPSPATHHTSNQSPSPANKSTAKASPAAATQRASNQSPAANVWPISHLLLLLLDVLPISHFNLLLLL